MLATRLLRSGDVELPDEAPLEHLRALGIGVAPHERPDAQTPTQSPAREQARLIVEGQLARFQTRGRARTIDPFRVAAACVASLMNVQLLKHSWRGDVEQLALALTYLSDPERCWRPIARQERHLLRQHLRHIETSFGFPPVLSRSRFLETLLAAFRPTTAALARLIVIAVARRRETAKIDDAAEASPFVRRFVMETLRRVGPAWRLTRIVKTPLTLHTASIERGSRIIFPLHLMHHDHAQHPCPFDFVPERFLHQHAMRTDRWLAFGVGERRCPARALALAWLEAALRAMAPWLSSFELNMSDDVAFADTVAADGNLLLLPAQLRLKRRSRE
jgi:hypothetical protein